MLPACAGVILSQKYAKNFLLYAPRMRGGDPATSLEDSQLI